MKGERKRKDGRYQPGGRGGGGPEEGSIMSSEVTLYLHPLRSGRPGMMGPSREQGWMDGWRDGWLMRGRREDGWKTMAEQEVGKETGAQMRTVNEGSVARESGIDRKEPISGWVDNLDSIIHHS